MTHADRFIAMLKEQGSDVELVKTDDLGPHFVQWVEKEKRVGIWFYVDDVRVKIIVEHIGSEATMCTSAVRQQCDGQTLSR